jgi:N-acyl-D-amino-acid deacylase
MSREFDLVIGRGTVLDGDGSEGRLTDVGIRGGRIAEIGDLAGRGREEIDARGLLVTPGFVDVHTHYDGQVTWENRISGSSAHGVTTVVMGNCGVGFAPCRAADRESLLNVMEGVEDIPELVMNAGLPWNWETFPQYLNSLESRHFDIDVGTQLPHSALRVYAMGQRGANREVATQSDKKRMAALAFEAMSAGALGFSTSRNPLHATIHGDPIPSYQAVEAELGAIAGGLSSAKRGVLQALPSFDDFDAEFAMFKRLARQSGRPLSYSLVQMSPHSDLWRHALQETAAANAEGLPIKAQVMGRPTGILLGLDLSYNPFSFFPTYQSIAHLPLEQRVAMLRQREFRAKLLAERPLPSTQPVLSLLKKFDAMYALGDPPNYEPARESSIVAIAERSGRLPLEVALDMLLEKDGNNIIFTVSANYVAGNLDAALEMIQHPNTILALGDGGAHYGLISDSSYPTFMLTFWCRDRAGAKVPLSEMVRKLSSVPAKALGLNDRGRIAPGLKADINIIDFHKLRLHAPTAHYDLPAGGRRVLQTAEGFHSTLVNGIVSQRHGEPTGELPGRLVRGTRDAA